MNFIVMIVFALALIVSIRFVSSVIEKVGDSKSVSAYRVKYISKTVNLSLIVFYVILLVTFLGIEYSQVSIFFSSVFAVIGVALFAQWSILSNITASLIIFFAFPYRVGDTVKVVDKDDDISGVIEEISLFHVLVRRGDDVITYPNTLILQKAVVKLSVTPTFVPKSQEILTGKEGDEG
jgi:small-conductance mechanosensitive channel